MSRKLTAFQPATAQSVLPPAVVRRRLRLAQLIQTPLYADLKEIAAGVVTPHSAVIPHPATPLSGVVGYFTFSVVRDVLNQFFAAVEAEAALATPNEDALNE